MESLVIIMFFIGDSVISAVVIITVTLSVLKFYSVSLLFLTRYQGNIFTSKLKVCCYTRRRFSDISHSFL